MNMLLKSFAVACLVGCAIAQTAVNPCAIIAANPKTGFVPDPSACENYFSCVGGIAFPAKCPSPLVYVPAASTAAVGTAGTCVARDAGNCLPCRGTGITKVANPTSCSKWTLCIATVAKEQTCLEGTLFNSAIGSCDLKENVKCDVDPCAAIVANTEIFVPNPVDSTKYNLCDFDSKKTVESLTCPIGTNFALTSQSCIKTPKVC